MTADNGDRNASAPAEASKSPEAPEAPAADPQGDWRSAVLAVGAVAVLVLVAWIVLGGGDSLQRAESAIAAGDPDRAVRMLDRMLEDAPAEDIGYIHLLRFQAHRDLNNRRLALEAMEQAVEHAPDERTRTRWMEELGMATEHAGLWAEAEDVWRRLLQRAVDRPESLDPDADEVPAWRMRLVHSLFRQEEHDAVVEEARALVEHLDANADDARLSDSDRRLTAAQALLWWGRSLMARERLDEAAEVLARAEERQPSVTDASLYRGRALRRAGRPEEAAQVLAAAVDRAEARLATLEGEEGAATAGGSARDTAQAAATLRLNTLPTLLLESAAAHRDARDLEGALADLARMRELRSPGDLEAGAMEWEVLVLQGRYDDALDLLDELAAANAARPGAVPALEERRITTLAAAGRTDDALRAAADLEALPLTARGREVGVSSRNVAAAQHLSVLLHLQRDRLEDARAELHDLLENRRAVGSVVGLASTHALAGAVEAWAGDADAARAAWADGLAEVREAAGDSESLPVRLLATLAGEGDADAIATAADRSGDDTFHATVLLYLGLRAEVTGDTEAARARLEAARDAAWGRTPPWHVADRRLESLGGR